MKRQKKIVMIAGPNGDGKTTFLYLSLATPELAVARVVARVAQGGHNVPEHVIRRRYVAGWRNFQQKFRPLVDAWAHYDNSGERPVLVERGING